jgi:hypothetical protein
MALGDWSAGRLQPFYGAADALVVPPDLTLADGRRTASPVADRTAMTNDALVPLLLAAAVLNALLAPLHLALQAPGEGRVVALVSTALATVFGSAWAACRVPAVGRAVRTHADVVGLVGTLLTSLHGFTVLLVTREPATAGSIVLFVVVVGAISTVRRHAALLAAVGVAQWLVVAAAEGLRGEWAMLTVPVLCAPVLSGVLWTARFRTADSLAAAQAALLEAAMSDEMTGLRNRRGLLAAGREVLTPRPRPGPARRPAVPRPGRAQGHERPLRPHRRGRAGPGGGRGAALGRPAGGRRGAARR